MRLALLVLLAVVVALAVPGRAPGATLRPGHPVIEQVRARAPGDLWLVARADRCATRVDAVLPRARVRVTVGVRTTSVRLGALTAGRHRVRLSLRTTACRRAVVRGRLALRPRVTAPAPAPRVTLPAVSLPAPVPQPAVVSPVSPFAGRALYVDPSNGAQHVLDTAPLSTSDRALLTRIATAPQAKWFGDWDGADPRAHVAAYVDAAHAQGAMPVLVVYDRPHRDGGGASAGGAASVAGYRAWIDGVAAAVTAPAAVIVEPDGLPQLDDLGSDAERADVVAAISYAAAKLGALPGVAVYLDAGHSDWRSPGVMAQRLSQAGIAATRGFSTNIANYRRTADELVYARALAALLPGTHVVIDTGRNGQGPAAGPGATTWCNPPGRGLGTAPTATTGDPLVDAYLWIKRPGESDGPCNGGPPAGEFWPDAALELARNAA